MRFMLAFPTADELMMFTRVSFISAFRDSKRWLQMAADPAYEGETRAHLFILNNDHLEYVRTLFVQSADVNPDEISRYLQLDPIKLFKGVYHD